MSEPVYMAHILALNARFDYQTDKAQYGFAEVWTDLDDVNTGDCEDYALHLFKNIGGCELWYCKVSGDGHAVLKLPDGQWIDNVYRKPIPKFDTRYTHFKKFNDFQVYAKLIVGWFLKRL